MNRLTIMGSVNPFSGYGRHLIRAAQDIEALTDTQVIIRPLKTHPDAPQFIKERIVLDRLECPWELIIAPPTVCPTPGMRAVYFTMNETTRLNNEAIHCLRIAEHVIVPNQWNKDCFIASGVMPPIHIVPLGIDHRIFNWRPLPPPSPVVFGTAGAGARKGIPDVIRAFIEAFPGRNDVRLKIKITMDDEVPDVVDPRIIIFQKNCPDDEMALWYGSLHCFVSASRGEGWGLMQQEADCMGRVVLTSPLGGGCWMMVDRPDCPPVLCDAPAPYAGQWEKINPADLRWAIQEIAFEIENGAADPKPKLSQFTWDRSSAELIRVLTEVGAIKAFGVGSGDGDRPGLARADRPPETAGDKIASDRARIKELPAPPKYYHSGNLGDIIYGLYAIREHCGDRGADLIIGPCQHQTGAHALKAPITKQQFDMLLPLLRTQKWIKRVRWSQFYPIAEEVHDMNGFRKLWPRRHVLGIQTLCEAQFEHLGIRDRFDPTHAWLDLQPSWEGTNLPRVVIHRSARWRQDDQMWRKLVNAHREKLLFVGTADEYFEFENTYGTVSFWKVRDFLEMAEIISFAIGFIGNQSFPMALAIGFGQNAFQEQSLATPDCTFDRPGTFWTQKDDVRTVVKGWL